MPTLTFNDVPSGLLTGYTSPEGFAFSTLKGPNAVDHSAFWNRSQINDLGTGAYLINQQSNDTVILRGPNGAVFGATSIDINGFDFLRWDVSGATPKPVTGTSVVTFTFVGVTVGGDVITYSATTDSVDGFQTVNLPSSFSAGLTELRWKIAGGTGWGAFDNLVLTQNHAPVAQAYTASYLGGDLYTGHLVATDADGQALTFHAVGALPDGVVLDANGAFYIEPSEADADMFPGQSRTISFSYAASDGATDSNTATVSVKVTALPLGCDIIGGNHPQSLVGTAAGERIWGGNSGDTLSGMAGNDTLAADNGKDVLLGGAGRDLLLGENGSDTLNGGAGDDTLIGGNSPDDFTFDRDFGHDVITDFDLHNDDISFSVSSFANYADVRAHATQTLLGTVITDDAGNSLTLLGVRLSQLSASDFLFH